MLFDFKKFKLGLDIHGVITANPQMFSDLSKRMFRCGTLMDGSCEIHVITGAHKTDELINRLRNEHKIKFTHFFSIADHHKKIGTKVWYDNKGTPWMDEEAWDRTKAEYCARENIDLHIDDTERYGKYFTTPFMLYIK